MPLGATEKACGGGGRRNCHPISLPLLQNRYKPPAPSPQPPAPSPRTPASSQKRRALASLKAETHLEGIRALGGRAEMGRGTITGGCVAGRLVTT